MDRPSIAHVPVPVPRSMILCGVSPIGAKNSLPLGSCGLRKRLELGRLRPLTRSTPASWHASCHPCSAPCRRWGSGTGHCGTCDTETSGRQSPLSITVPGAARSRRRNIRDGHSRQNARGCSIGCWWRRSTQAPPYQIRHPRRLLVDRPPRWRPWATRPGATSLAKPSRTWSACGFLSRIQTPSGVEDAKQ